MEYVCTPNLPQGKVSIAAVSVQGKNIITALEHLGVKCIAITPHYGLPEPIQTHADILLYHLGGGQIIAAETNLLYIEPLKMLGFEVIPLTQSLHTTYPQDCALNAVRIGHTLFCGQHTAPEITEYCNKNGISITYVSQGYARCSTAIVSTQAVITADPSIAQACEKSGIDVLVIQPGYIRLPGYPYGFIGGCCGLIDKDILVFTGDILSHPDGERITEFFKKHHVKYIALTDGELTDIGGILPLMCSPKN